MLTEREQIVAFIRAEGERPIVPGSLRGPEALLMVADAIERGDHLVWRPAPSIPASEWVKVPSVGH